MKFLNSVRVLALFICLFTFSQPVWSQPAKGVSVTLQVVKSPSPLSRKVFDNKSWYSKVDSQAFQVIGELVFDTRFGKDSLQHVGRKMPIVYKDPRADGYQVQYTDHGIKCDVTVNELTGGLLKVQIRPEMSKAAPNKVFPDRVDAMIAETTLVMRRGQTVILSSSRGILNRTFFNERLSAEDTVMFVLSLR